MKIKDLCESERPREKMVERGANSLSNGELLAVLIRSGNRNENVLELAQRILSMAGGNLVSLFEMSFQTLCEIPGIKVQKATSIMAALELGRRFMLSSNAIRKQSVTTAEMAYRLILPRMKGIRHEECWVMFLNASNYIIETSNVSSGGDSSTTIDCRQIIRMALEKKASSIILFHNHPSSNPRPSDSDIKETELLHDAAESLGISLMDHIIVCDDCYFSFAEGF